MQMSLLLAIAFQDPSASLMQQNGHLAYVREPIARIASHGDVGRAEGCTDLVLNRIHALNKAFIK